MLQTLLKLRNAKPVQRNLEVLPFYVAFSIVWFHDFENLKYVTRVGQCTDHSPGE